MAQAFIIMQIGNNELDQVCEKAIVPAIVKCGFEPKRVDKHNEGGLLKSEIIKFIEQSDIIIADLTNERPNCYLEIGYAMGIDKFRNLILTGREDHNQGSPNYVQGGPKVHFDLSGYDILFWGPQNLDEFRGELEKRIRRRQAILKPSQPTEMTPWDNNWVDDQRNRATSGLQATGMRSFMEIRFALDHPKPTKTQKELDSAARISTIDTFGWPIGIYMTKEEYRPRPRQDGISANIAVKDRASFDYWALRRNGDFYLLKTIFEDMRDQKKIFFDTRIIRITETLLYCARLYSNLEIDPTTTIHIAIKHGGLQGRVLNTANSRRMMVNSASIDEDQVEEIIHASLGQLESNIVQYVKQLAAPLLILFDFYEPSDKIYEEIVNEYIQGRIA